MDKEIVGPSYGDVAKKYHTRKDARTYLTGKILSGGSGVWGGKAMPMQSQLTEEQASTMAAFILSLLDDQPKPKNLPPAGSLRANQHRGAGEGSTYTLQVSYQDQGGEVIGPLRSDYTLSLKSPKIQGEECDLLGSDDTQIRNPENAPSFIRTRRKGYATFRGIDLTGIGKLTLRYGAIINGIKLEIRLDSPDGQLIGSQDISKTGSETKFANVDIAIDNTSGFHDLYFVVVAEPNPKENRRVFSIDWMYFHPQKSLVASN
ncbi:UNVERIFIED_CONTAM: hypothetical protein GTU68_001260 [Idotea baltica]|nr:hypothetical protein [Idotea baltica]